MAIKCFFPGNCLYIVVNSVFLREKLVYQHSLQYIIEYIVWFMIKDEFTLERINHWNSIAELPDSNRNWGNAYHKRIQKLFKSIIPSGHSIVEIGCGKGNLLAFLHPLQGLGVDFSPKMILSAREKYPELNFQIQDAHELKLDQKFDYVIMSDLVNDLWNVQQVTI